MQPTYFIAGGLLLVIVLRRVAPLVASVLGLALTFGMGIWGYTLYQNNSGIVFAGHTIALSTFLAFVGLIFTFEIVNLTLALRRRSKSGERTSN